MTREERELYALVSQAFDLRGSPYYLDALQAILDWHYRRHQRWLEYLLEEHAWYESIGRLA